MSYPPQNGPPPVPPMPQAPPKKKRKASCLGIGCGGLVLLAIIIGIAIAASGGGSKNKTSTAPAPAPASSAPGTRQAAPAPAPSTARPPSSQAGPATSFSGDGEYQVGKDIAAGTYKSAGPASSDVPSCYWERDKDATGNFDSIITNDSPTGAAVVTIKPTDKIFKTQGCKQWSKVG